MKTLSSEGVIMDDIKNIKLDCAHDSSLKTICMSFLSEIDAVLGTNYVKDIGRKTFSTSAMVNNMAHLSKLHALGILVIDEIQYLLSAQGSNYEKVMNFFASLSNSVGVPLLLMGTMKAREILQSILDKLEDNIRKYMRCVSVDDLKQGNGLLQKHALLHTLFFLLGFSVIFLALGFSTSFLGEFFLMNDEFIRHIGSIFLLYSSNLSCLEYSSLNS